MATVPAEITWVTGQIVTAAQLNANLRDAINFLIAPPLFVGRQTVAQNGHHRHHLDAGHLGRRGQRQRRRTRTVTNTSRYTAQTQGWYDLDSPHRLDGQQQRRPVDLVDRQRRRPGGQEPARRVAGTRHSAGHGGASVFLNVGDYTETTMWHNSTTAPAERRPADGNPRFQVRWIST
jgi:hypothetical protein